MTSIHLIQLAHCMVSIPISRNTKAINETMEFVQQPAAQIQNLDKPQQTSSAEVYNVAVSRYAGFTSSRFRTSSTAL